MREFNLPLKCSLRGCVKVFIEETLIIFGLSIMGTMLLLLVFCLPSKPIEDNVSKSGYLFEESGPYPVANLKYESAMDYYTDAIILLESSNDSSESIVNRAMKVYRSVIDDSMPVETVVANSKKSSDVSRQELEYSRYWHGFLVYIRPLLEFFNYRSIRIIGYAAQLILLFAIGYKLVRIRRPLLAFAFLCSYASLSIKALGYCLQYWPSSFIALFSSILVIYMNEHSKLSPRNTVLVFTVIGAAINYFDFLTFPIVTLAIPLCLLVALRFHSDSYCGLACCLCSIFSWAYGYGLMWILKWLLGTLLTGENLFHEALASAKYRSGMLPEYSYSLVSTIRVNFDKYINNPTVTIATAVLVVTLIVVCAVWFIGIDIDRKKLFRASAFVVIMLLVPAWYRAFLQHSYVHSFMVNRDFVIVTFSLLMGCAVLIEQIALVLKDGLSCIRISSDKR